MTIRFWWRSIQSPAARFWSSALSSPRSAFMSTSSTIADWRRQANLSRAVSRLFSRSIASRSIIWQAAPRRRASRCEVVVVGLPWLWPCRSARVRSGGRGWDASACLLPSVVVASPSDVGVPDRLAFRGAFPRVGLVEPMPQDRSDGAVAGRADVVAAMAGGFEPLPAVALLQSHDPDTAPQPLLGLGLRLPH